MTDKPAPPPAAPADKLPAFSPGDQCLFNGQPVTASGDYVVVIDEDGRVIHAKPERLVRA